MISKITALTLDTATLLTPGTLVASPSNSGSATFGLVFATARGNAFGGGGGNGGSGTVAGNGGSGGAGYGGFAGLLVRGSPVTFGDFFFDGSGSGGDGGTGHRLIVRFPAVDIRLPIGVGGVGKRLVDKLLRGRQRRGRTRASRPTAP